uniref:Origin recognition complex subunit 2 n=1 Tax=Anopheles farauti TaxID=69004 RepID=A0A182QE57_9DIPT
MLNCNIYFAHEFNMSRRKSVHVPLKLSQAENCQFVDVSSDTSEDVVDILNTGLTSDLASSDDKQKVSEADVQTAYKTRRSLRIRSPSKRYTQNYVMDNRTPQRRTKEASTSEDSDCDSNDQSNHLDEAVQAAGMDMLGKKLSATTLFEAQTDVAGGGIYGFRTPKKRGSMNALALASSTQRTPVASISHAVPKTPMHLRRLAKKEMSKALQASLRSDFSASESDYEPSEEENDIDDSGSSNSEDEESSSEKDTEQDEAAGVIGSKRSAGRRYTTGVGPKLEIPVPAKVAPEATSNNEMSSGIRRSGQRIEVQKESEELQYILQSDDYFSTFNNAKTVTSDHTLDRLNTPRLTQDVLFRLLEQINASSSHTGAIQELLDEHMQQLQRWLCWLDQGFNVLLYGLGSKRSLLQTFHRTLLAERPVVVVNGFFPALTVKDVLDAVANELLELRLQSGNHHEAIDEIERELSFQPNLHVFLLVHNLDGVAMRNERMQATLCRLASIPNVHLLATIDHINAPLLWDASKLSLYNFCWWDTTTMLPYSVETAFENSLLVQNAGAPALSSMKSVFASLTSNARGIFMSIVKHQLKNGGHANPHYTGMLLKDLYWACREAFLVSSDIALRAQLTEFTDHKLLRIKRTADGAENLLIPIEHGLLQRFFDETGQDAS